MAHVSKDLKDTCNKVLNGTCDKDLNGTWKQRYE